MRSGAEDDITKYHNVQSHQNEVLLKKLALWTDARPPAHRYTSDSEPLESIVNFKTTYWKFGGGDGDGLTLVIFHASDPTPTVGHERIHFN
jgi:hypothetical protein